MISAHPGPPPAVLMVDDHPANLLALEAILEPVGCELVAARSGEEAIRQITHRDFAVVLMDVQMPGLDGFETTKRIKSRESSRHVPVIFITALEHDGHVFRGYEHGAADYLMKPVDPDILRYKVAVFVELHLLRERVRAQAELLQAEELALAQAKSAVRAREDVLAIVSHDLGNPIAAIDALAQLIARRGVAIGDAQLSKLAERQHVSLGKMKRLVTDLLDASRIESGNLRLHLQLHHVDELLRTAYESVLPLANEKRQTLTRRAPAPAVRVCCDGDRIDQVLANLLGNAIKFAPIGACIDIAATIEGAAVTFTVSDDGPGIDEADLPRLFDKYWRPPGAQRPGVGLGLAIAKGIVEAHGGRIWAESRRGLGSQFSFVLSTAEEAEAARAS